MNCGGIVLCGGQSTRMGVPKLALPFGPERMLQRVVRLLREVVEETIVVAAPNQDLPELPANTRIVYDRHQGRGPLEGLRAGLEALPENCEAAYVTGCDVPLLVPSFVARMIDLLTDHAIAVAVTDGRTHPLAAVYRSSVLDSIEALLTADRMRPAFLFDLVPTRRVTAVELLDVDAQLATLKNVNSPADYHEALANAGFLLPGDVHDTLSKLDDWSRKPS